MVRISLSNFIFMLMLTLLEARDSIFKHPSYQGLVEIKVSPQSENVIVEAKGIHPITIVVKEIRSSEVFTEEESSNVKLNKRKLASQGIFKKEKEQAKMSIDGTSSKISGATPSSWNSCNHNGKRKLDVVCKQSGRRSSSVRRRRPKKAKFPVGFVALNADYHYPNSHPPRHN